MFRLNKYLTRLILFSIGVSTLPVILLGIVIYLETTATIQEKVNEGNEQILEQTRLRVEEVLLTIDRQMTQLADSRIVTQALTEDISPDKFEFFRDLTTEMYRVQTFDVGVQDVHLVNLNNAWILNNYGFSYLADFARKDRISQYLNMNESTFWTSERESISTNNDFSINRIITLTKKMPIYSSNPHGMLIVEIPSYELKNFLSKSSNLGEVIILDDSYRTLVTRNEKLPFSSEIMDEIIQRLKSIEESSGLFKSVPGNSQYGVVFQKSSFNQWMYLSVIPLDEIYAESRRTGFIVLLLGIGILLLAVYVALKGSHQIYLPIQRLYDSVFANQRNNKGKRIDELYQLNERFKSIQHVQTQMMDESNHHIRQLEELYVLKIIQGGMKPADIQENMAMISYDVEKYKWFAVIMIQIDSLVGTRFQERDNELLLFAISNIVGEQIPANHRLLPIIIRSSQVTLLHGNQNTIEEFRQFVFSSAKQIQTQVERYLSLKISIGISRFYEEIKDSNSAYKECQLVLKYRLLYDEKTILSIEEIRPDKDVTMEFPRELEREILDEIKVADLSKISPLLDGFFAEISTRSTNYNEYQIAVARFFIGLVRVMQETGFSQQDLIGDEPPYLEQLFALKTTAETQQWLMIKMIEPMVAMFQERKTTSYQNISKEVVEMIHDQYDTDITLESCANYLNYHPSYISRILKRELNSSFSEYLMQYRLKIAKEMLQNTDVKIKDIARKLRYNNPQNFIRNFRRIEGMTPGEFRTKHSNVNEK